MNCKRLEDKMTRQLIISGKEDLFNGFAQWCEERDLVKATVIRRLIEEKIYGHRKDN